MSMFTHPWMILVGIAVAIVVIVLSRLKSDHYDPDTLSEGSHRYWIVKEHRDRVFRGHY